MHFIEPLKLFFLLYGDWRCKSAFVEQTCNIIILCFLQLIALSYNPTSCLIEKGENAIFFMSKYRYVFLGNLR